MKTILVEARRKFKDSEIKYNLLDEIKDGTIALAATVQYIGLIPKVKSYLESKGKRLRLNKVHIMRHMFLDVTLLH